MQRFHQLLFCFSVVALSWYAMMAVHELGHVVGALATGGTVEHVVLHPLAISRTDVAPNPQPSVVVWLGPVIGCALPLLVLVALPGYMIVVQKVTQFFAGFCLVANGAYLSLGSIGQVGDCGEMLRTGTPLWAMIAYGVATISWGFYLWHRLGSLKYFLGQPELVTTKMVFGVITLLIVLVVSGISVTSLT